MSGKCEDCAFSGWCEKRENHENGEACDEFEDVDQPISYTGIPEELYYKIYLRDDEGNWNGKFYVDLDLLDQLNQDQICEVRLDIDRCVDDLLYGGSIDNCPEFAYNYKLCHNIINTYYRVKYQDSPVWNRWFYN